MARIFHPTFDAAARRRLQLIHRAAARGRVPHDLLAKFSMLLVEHSRAKAVTRVKKGLPPMLAVAEALSQVQPYAVAVSQWLPNLMEQLRDAVETAVAVSTSLQTPERPQRTPKEILEFANEKHYRKWTALYAQVAEYGGCSHDAAKALVRRTRNGETVADPRSRDAMARAIRDAGFPCTADDLIWPERA